MALLSQQLQRFLLTGIDCNSSSAVAGFKANTKTRTRTIRSSRSPCCSAIAIDAPSSLSDVAGIRWGSTKLQGPREEMEDDVVVRSDGIGGFSFAAVFDGHAGFSSVKFLRDELYKECIAALQGGSLLSGKDSKAVKTALQGAFETADAKLIKWLEMTGEDVESGATATVMLIGNDMLFISHVGDSCAVLSRSGKAEVLTTFHRPYGSNKVLLQEIRRIREAGGWSVELRNGHLRSVNFTIRSQVTAQSKRDGRGRQVWRRRKLMKKDDMLRYKMERVPFLEEQVRKVRETGKLLTMDIERLLLSEENRFDFVNEVAAEAKEYVENNRDEYGGEKKAILHVLSNRINDAGFFRPDAYVESDPFKPGPGYLKEVQT